MEELMTEIEELNELEKLIDEILQLEKDLVIKEAEVESKKLDLVAKTYKLALQIMTKEIEII